MGGHRAPLSTASSADLSLTTAPRPPSITVAPDEDTVQAVPSLVQWRTADSGAQVSVFVDYLEDSAANASQCTSTTAGLFSAPYTGECNLRSALEYCSLLDRSSFNECSVRLPSSPGGAEVHVDPQYGELRITPSANSASVSLYGSGCNISPVGYGTTRLFVVDATSASVPAGYSLQIYNVSVLGFGDESLDGGALHVSGAVEIQLTDVSFIDNIGMSGGAVYLELLKSAEFSYCIFSHNVADFLGGGIVVLNSNYTTINDSIFARNTAYNGGGIFGLNCIDFVVAYSSFVGNKVSRSVRELSDSNGGGIYAANSVRFTIADTIFYNNSAASSGGALSVYSVYGLSVDSSSFYLNRALFGGAFEVVKSLGAFLHNSSFVSNIAQIQGGAIIGNRNGGMIVISSIFCDNEAEHGGGAMYLWETDSL